MKHRFEILVENGQPLARELALGWCFLAGV